LEYDIPSTELDTLLPDSTWRIQRADFESQNISQVYNGSKIHKNFSRRGFSWRIFFLGIILTLTLSWIIVKRVFGKDRPSKRWQSFVLQEALFGRFQDPDNDCATRNEAVDQGLQLPLTWIHFPKCGTNFVNSMFHSACCVDSQSNYYGNKKYGKDFWFIRDLEYGCHGGWSDSERDGYQSFSPWHAGYGPYVKRYWGNAVALFRQPEQRMISGWLHKTASGLPHGWVSPATKFLWPVHMLGYLRPTLDMYRERVAGCITKMLTRGGPNACGSMPQPTALEASLALEYLDGFQFVGLREEWELSVCLWHAKFGGKCYWYELEHYHTAQKHSVRYNTDLLDGWTDPWDGPIFEKVRNRFHLDLIRFNVTKTRCRMEICTQRNRDGE